MSGADLIRATLLEEFSPSQIEDELAALDALVAEIVKQADRIAWLEGEVAGWRIKLAECEERHR